MKKTIVCLLQLATIANGSQQYQPPPYDYCTEGNPCRYSDDGGCCARIEAVKSPVFLKSWGGMKEGDTRFWCIRRGFNDFIKSESSKKDHRWHDYLQYYYNQAPQDEKNDVLFGGKGINHNLSFDQWLRKIDLPEFKRTREIYFRATCTENTRNEIKAPEAERKEYTGYNRMDGYCREKGAQNGNPEHWKPLGTRGWKDCSQRCKQENWCNAWTIYHEDENCYGYFKNPAQKDGDAPNIGNCYIKEQETKRKEFVGYKRMDGYCREKGAPSGNPEHWKPLGTRGQKICSQICKQEEWCNAWTIYHEDGNCYGYFKDPAQKDGDAPNFGNCYIKDNHEKRETGFLILRGEDPEFTGEKGRAGVSLVVEDTDDGPRVSLYTKGSTRTMFNALISTAAITFLAQ